MSKRMVASLLMVCMIFTLTACGNKAFNKSKEAYGEISIAYAIADQMSSDVYEAWRLGIYDKDEILDDGASYLAKELSLSEDEIIEGIVYTMMSITSDTSYEEADDETKKEARELAGSFFSYMKDDLFSVCVMAVSNAYKANGKASEAQAALDNAKVLMQEMSKKYSDYEHYPNLKEYYTNTSSLFDFCQNPEGSFEQVKDTINDYRNEARDYKSDLDYIFEWFFKRGGRQWPLRVSLCSQECTSRASFYKLVNNMKQNEQNTSTLFQ